MSDRELLERHPWNVDFAWQPCRGPFRRLSTEQAEQFDSLGFVVIEDAVDASTLEVVIREVDRFERELEAFLRTQTDDRAFIAEADAITFTTHLVARSAVIRALAVTDVFVDLAADLMGPDVNMYWDQAVYKKPEKPRRFPWHQDNGYTFIEPQQYLTCWVAAHRRQRAQRVSVDRRPVSTGRARSRTPTSIRSDSSASRNRRLRRCRLPCAPGARSCSRRSHRT